MPLANALLNRKQLLCPERTYPLDLAFCPNCSLLQITETVPPEELFREYPYFSSFSDTMLRHARDLVERLVISRGLAGRSLVVEIASNDGYLLQYYHQQGIPVLGIEPAANVAQEAEEKRGVRTLCDFFDQNLAQRLRAAGYQADVVHAHNVMAHVADLNGFVEGIGLLLREGGVAVIEVPYVRDLVEHCEFDTVYHEHLCYFSLTALHSLFERHGLAVVDVERIAIHGGSLRVTVAPKESARPRRAVQDLLDQERREGVDQLAYYAEFGERIEALKRDLLGRLRHLKRQGDRLAAYGASAKGSTLMNCFHIGGELLDFVVDRSTVKQGLYTPGNHLPIFPPEKLIEQMPDYVLLLTWNFVDEILRQQEEYLRRGGRFMVPIPEVRVVGLRDVPETQACAELPV
jgi:SAM-dependent methyltransferase